eukprot:6114557-Prymnesium_polylepis.1
MQSTAFFGLAGAYGTLRMERSGAVSALLVFFINAGARRPSTQARWRIPAPKRVHRHRSGVHAALSPSGPNPQPQSCSNAAADTPRRCAFMALGWSSSLIWHAPLPHACRHAAWLWAGRHH